MGLFFLFELISLMALLVMGRNLHWNYEEALNRTPETVFADYPNPEELVRIYGSLLDTGSVHHPYFAFRYTPGHGDIHGFSGDVEFPFEKRPSDFIIAILGGSVGEQLSDYIFGNKTARRKLVHVLQKNYPKAKGKDIKIKSLSITGGLQPQQFFISSYFLRYLDMTINIEGSNETDHLPPRHYPLGFPSERGHYSYLNLNKQREKIIFLRKMANFSRLDKHIPILKFSHSFFLFHQLFNTILLQNILKLKMIPPPPPGR